jgi:hypothetical protein
VDGVHEYGLGETVNLYLDPRRLFVFSDTGTLAAAPERTLNNRGTA